MEGTSTNVPGHPGSFLAVLSSLFFWFAYYNILCLRSPHRSYEWHCRVVTATHAIIITGMSFFFGIYYSPWLFTEAGGPNTVYEVVTITVCLGYFLFDFAWCLYFWGNETPLMLLHHIVSVIGLSASLYWGISGTEVNGVIFGSEVSNPLLQLRWFLRESNNSGNILYEVNDLLFIVVFLLCRICIGTYLFYTHFHNPRPAKFFRIGAAGMYFVSWCFMIGILQFAFRKYSKMYRNWNAQKNKCISALANGGSKTKENGVQNGDAKKMN